MARSPQELAEHIARIRLTPYVIQPFNGLRSIRQELSLNPSACEILARMRVEVQILSIYSVGLLFRIISTLNHINT